MNVADDPVWDTLPAFVDDPDLDARERGSD
jgi:hypothetical protein